MIVVDASAILELLLDATAASDIENRLLGTMESLHAPHLLDLEVAQVLRIGSGHRLLTSFRHQQLATSAS